MTKQFDPKLQMLHVYTKPYELSIEPCNGNSYLWDYHLGIDLEMAMKRAEEIFEHITHVNETALYTVALIRNHKIVDVWDGADWNSDSIERMGHERNPNHPWVLPRTFEEIPDPDVTPEMKRTAGEFDAKAWMDWLRAPINWPTVEATPKAWEAYIMQAVDKRVDKRIEANKFWQDFMEGSKAHVEQMERISEADQPDDPTGRVPIDAEQIEDAWEVIEGYNAEAVAHIGPVTATRDARLWDLVMLSKDERRIIAAALARGSILFI